MRQLGIFSWFGFRLPLAERLDLIAQAGFQTTALWLGTAEELVAADRTAEMPVLARSAGLAVDNIHLPYADCNALWSESAVTAAAEEARYAAGLRFCQAHTIPVCVAHVTQGSESPPVTARALRRFDALADEAADRGVALALENTAGSDHLDAVLSHVQSPGLGLCYDSSHDFLGGMTRGGVLRRWGHRLATVHLSDNHGQRDDHLLPGTGTIPWDAIAQVFPSEGYTGTILLEVYPAPGDVTSPSDFLRTAHAAAESLRARLIPS